MDSTLNRVQEIETRESAELAAVSAATRLARYCALDEVPGLIFGIMTAVYIIHSLAGLIR